MIKQLSIAEVHVDPWGKCLEMKRGGAELRITLDVGPRIIGYSLDGGPNMLFEDLENGTNVSGDVLAPVGGGEWRIYGGHRLWTSPESIPRTTVPDNRPVAWKPIDGGVSLESEIEPGANVRKSLDITMDAEGGVRIVHRIRNAGLWPITFAAWALTMMAPGGVAIVPWDRQDTGLLPNRLLALWPYAAPNDARVNWGKRLVTLRQTDDPQPFKFGTNNTEGWAAYANKGILFVKRYDHLAGETYPDGGVSFEAYTNHLFLELETLSPLRQVEPGGSIEHVETWSLYGGVSMEKLDEDAIAEQLQAIIQL